MKNKPYPLYELPNISDLKDMVRQRASRAPDEIAFSYSGKKSAIINKTNREFSDDINRFGTYLYSKGLQNKHISIVAENSYEWLVAFLAIANGNNVVVPIDYNLSGDKIKELLTKSDCDAVVASRKIHERLADCSLHILSIDRFEEYLSNGDELIRNGDTEYVEHKVDAEKFSAIFFTSGTTGDSKGVMLSHKNIVYDFSACRKYAKVTGSIISVLPFYHTFGLIIGVFSVYAYGCTLYINKDLKRFLSDLKIAKPTAVALVPLFVETIYKTIKRNIKAQKKENTIKVAETIGKGFTHMGLDIRNYLFKAISETLGGNLQYIVCGGAPLDPNIVDEFRTWGIHIINGYGITECSPVVSLERNHYWKSGSVGQIIEKSEVKIADDGEILVKGENVMLGYYRDEEATKAVINDGWFSTGDLGEIDKDGFLFITGRKKNLIILSNGENVSPEELESLLLKDENVSEALVYDENNVLVAEIFPEDGKIGDEQYFERLVEQINRQQPSYKQINKIKLRDSKFERNTSGKILRDKIGGKTNV